jgi:hypothetical protein
LLLAARELRRLVVGALLEADLGERLERAGTALAGRHARVDERQLDVAERARAR